MSKSGDEEFALVCACAAWPPSAGRTGRVRALAANGVDWARVARIARRHRVSALAQDALGRAGLPVPPAMAQDARAAMFHALRLAGEALQLDDRFAEGGVPVLFLKGAALAQRLYGSTGIRHSNDVDAVIADGDVARAWAVLDASGYRRLLPQRELSPAAMRAFRRVSKDSLHRHPGRRTMVELHWRLSEADRRFALPPPGEWCAVEIAAGRTLHTLGDEALFVYLCVHGAGHAWSRLKWLADIAAFVAGRDDGGAGLWAAARAAGAQRSAAAGMILAHELLGSALPAGFAAPRSLRLGLLLALSRRMLRPRPGDAELDDTVWRALAGPIATLTVTSDWRGALAVVRRMLVPAEDIALLQLPAALSFLYPVLRLPMWLWKRSPWSPRAAAVRRREAPPLR